MSNEKYLSATGAQMLASQPAMSGVVTNVDTQNKSITVSTPAGQLQMTQDLLNQYANQSDHYLQVQAHIDALKNQIIHGQGLSASSIFGINPITYGQWMANYSTPTPEELAQKKEEARIHEEMIRARVMDLFLTQEPAYREAFLMDHRSNQVQHVLEADGGPIEIFLQGYYFKLRDFEDWHATALIEDTFLAVVN